MIRDDPLSCPWNLLWYSSNDSVPASEQQLFLAVPREETIFLGETNAEHCPREHDATDSVSENATACLQAVTL